MYVRKGDTVVVITGRDKGRRGRILRVIPKEERVVIEGVNVRKKHQRANSRNQQGGIIEREMPVHISNIMPWCESAGQPSKIVMKRLEDGSRVRMYKINGETLNDK